MSREVRQAMPCSPPPPAESETRPVPGFSPGPGIHNQIDFSLPNPIQDVGRAVLQFVHPLHRQTGGFQKLRRAAGGDDSVPQSVETTEEETDASFSLSLMVATTVPNRGREIPAANNPL